MIAQEEELERPASRGIAREEDPAGLLRFVPSIYTVATASVLLAIFIAGLLPRIDTDFWWHIKVGQYIAQHHVVPSRDYMSFTFRGHAWTDHEWLSELMMYGLYRLAGLWGPIVFFAFVIVAAYSLVYATMLQLKPNRLVALFILALAFTASRGSWGPRIQMLSLLFVAGFVFLLGRYRQTRDRRILVAFPLLMLVWANLHGGFVLGLVVMGAVLVGEWLNRVTHHENALDAAGLKLLAIALVATLAVTVVNPNGLRQLLYPLAFVLPNAYTNQIQESASPDFHMLVMMVFEALLLLLVAALLFSRQRPNWTNFVLIAGFTHLALSQVRNVPLWTVVVSPLLVGYLMGAGPVLREQFGLQIKRRPVRGRIVPVLNGVLLVLVIIVYVLEAHTYITPKALAADQQKNYPVGAIRYLQTHSLPPRVFVSYGWGGYLLWNLSPRYTDYMDSRADTLFDRTILNNYLSAYDGAPQWQSVLSRYRVQDVLVERDAPLAQLLHTTPGWRLVYRDRLSVLYTRA